MITIENAQTDEATSLDYALHLIASRPRVDGRGLGRDGDPDDTATCLGTYATRDEAHRAGRAYLREHPGAWLQVQDVGCYEDGEDVEARS